MSTAKFNRGVKTEIMHALAKEGGGWLCHYCHDPLIPRGREELFCIIQYQAIGESETLGKVYLTPPGYSWPTLDHKLAQAHGGTHDRDNLVLACLQCNSKKAHRFTYEEFYELTAGFRERAKKGKW